MSNAEGMTKRVIRYIVTSLHRTNGSTIQRFNGLTWQSHSSFSSRAFTLIELIVVFGLIIVLTGLVLDRKSTRLNSSHQIISYAVFCLKKKKKKQHKLI